MEEREKLQTCAAQLLEVVSQTRSSINAHILQEIDRSQWVTPGQSRVLFLIDKGTNTIGDLAAKQKVSAPTVSRQIQGMVEKGLVLRERKKDDRRVVVLELSESGKDVLDRILSELQDWIAACLGELEAGQVDTVIEALGYLSEIFRVPGD